MATVYRVTNKLTMKNGLNKDAAINVHHVISQQDGTVPTAAMDAWCGYFVTFYQAIQGLWSPAVSAVANAHRLQVSKVSTGEAGVADDTVTPILWERLYTSSYAGASLPLPSEVAICLSHRGEITGAPEEGAGTSRPRSRRRGRIYIGPLNISAGTLDATTGFLLVATATQTTLLNAFEALAETMAANVNPGQAASYGVYSPTADTFYSVEQAHVDNAFDTIRRRGQAATGRTTRTVDLVLDHMGDVSEVA